MSDDLFRVMAGLKTSGKIRSWGVSVFTAAEAFHAIEGGADVIQINYSILEPDVGRAVFPVAFEKKVGVIVREALASGWLTGKFNATTKFPPSDQRSRKFPPDRIRALSEKVAKLDFLREECDTLGNAAIQFVLSQPAVSSVIIGCKFPEQVDANIRAAGKRLSQASLDKLECLFSIS